MLKEADNGTMKYRISEAWPARALVSEACISKTRCKRSLASQSLGRRSLLEYYEKIRF